jgi:HlyD family secretion protein/epimerase transport system membrane fusion protein
MASTYQDPEQTSLWRLIRGPALAGIAVIVIFVGGFGAWGALAPIAGAAVAPGTVSPKGNRKTVQHLEGGIIAELRVAEGDLVREGDPIVVLQEIQARAGFEMLMDQRRMLEAHQARLLAEQAKRDAIAFPDRLLAESNDPKVRELLDAQVDLFEARRDIIGSLKAILNKRIGQLEEQIAGLEAEIGSQSRQLSLIQEELEGKKVLLDKGLIPKPEYLRLARLKEEIFGERAQNRSDVARARQSIGETELEIAKIDLEMQDQIAQQLTQVQSELAGVRERLSAQDDVLRRTVIVAPVSGRVLNLQFHTAGGVVRPGEAILDIVPQGADLVIEARVSPIDIDVVHPGQDAQVHLTAYGQRDLPIVMGTLRRVSADALTDENTGERFYTAMVEVPRAQLDAIPQEVELTPGMPAEVLILTGERTLFDYMTRPLVDAVRRGFRES